MMKTIRRSVFETNSSSTHSITIRPVPDHDYSVNEPIVKNNILFPNRLSNYKGDVGEDEYLICNTYDLKAAIVCNWLQALADDQMSKKEFELFKNYLIRKLKYDNIVFEKDFPDYDPYTEYDRELSYGEQTKDQLDHLIEVINTEHLQIIDSYENY